MIASSIFFYAWILNFKGFGFFGRYLRIVCLFKFPCSMTGGLKGIGFVRVRGISKFCCQKAK